MSPIFQMNLQEYARQRMPGGLLPGEPEPEWLRRKGWIAAELEAMRLGEPKPGRRPRIFSRLRLAFSRA